MRATSTLLLLAAALLILPSCGGGGSSSSTPGGPPGPNPLALYSGTYGVASFGGTRGVPDTGGGFHGSAVPDGQGAIVGGQLTSNENGVLTGPIAFPSYSYTVDADRNHSWFLGSNEVIRGGISADGRFAASTTLSSTPSLFLQAKASRAIDATSELTGTWHLASLFYNHQVPGPFAGANWGRITFDGMGAVTGTVDANFEGVINQGFSQSETYSVSGAGLITMTWNGASVSGVAAEGDNVILLSGATNASDLPQLFALVRVNTGTSLGTPTLAGSYQLAGLTYVSGAGPRWITHLQKVTANGLGQLQGAGAGISNEEGIIKALAALNLQYSVAADGALTIASGDYFGAVDPSGTFAMFIGGAKSGDPSELFVLVR